MHSRSRIQKKSNKNQFQTFEKKQSFHQKSLEDASMLSRRRRLHRHPDHIVNFVLSGRGGPESVRRLEVPVITIGCAVKTIQAWW